MAGENGLKNGPIENGPIQCFPSRRAMTCGEGQIKRPRAFDAPGNLEAHSAVRVQGP